MNSAQLAQRLIRFTPAKDIALLTVEDAIRFVDIINSGLSAYHHRTPPTYRHANASVTLPAPVTGSFGLTQGSQIFTGYTATSSQEGSSVVFGKVNDPQQLVNTNQFLASWGGGTGTFSGTVYGDAIQLPSGVARVVTHPSIYGNVLERQDAQIWISPTAVGKPSAYKLEAVGSIGGAFPPFYLRVHPLPETSYVVSLTVELEPSQLVITDLSAQTTIPVRNGHVASFLLPIAEGELAMSDLWDSSIAKDGVMKRYENALIGLGQLESTDIALPANKIKSARGY